MPMPDESDIMRALQRTMNPQDADEAFERPTDLAGLSLVSLEDLRVLREVALARRDFDGQLQVSHALNVLNSKYAEYGRGQGSIRISRSDYDIMLAPQRIAARLNREKY